MNTRRTALVCLSLAMAMLLPAGLAGCQPSSRTETDQPLATLETEAAAFAPYREVPVNLKPSIAPYRAAADLSKHHQQGPL